jgi:ComF family protein
MADWWMTHGMAADLVLPVPLHPSRERQRGYNQAALLARQFGQLSGIPVAENVIVRVRPTISQMTLDAEARRRNVMGAFQCIDRQIEEGHLLLVDDVCTTGSTLDACACALYEAGAASVQALTLARAP